MINSQDFVDLLEQTYGKYPGKAMMIVIVDKLKDFSQDHLYRLYNEVVCNYMPSYSQPPTLAHILKYQRELPPAPRKLLEENLEGHVTSEEGERFIKELMKKLSNKTL